MRAATYTCSAARADISIHPLADRDQDPARSADTTRSAGTASAAPRQAGLGKSTVLKFLGDADVPMRRQPMTAAQVDRARCAVGVLRAVGEQHSLLARGRDIDLVVAHRTEILFQPWNELAGRGRPAGTWPEEAQLAHRAARAITAIQDTQIWAEPDLLDHRLRLDLPEASPDSRRSWQIHQLRRDLGPRPIGPGAEPPAAEWDVAATHLHNSLQVLRGHVEAIESYRPTIEDRNGKLLRQRRDDQLRIHTDGAAAQLAGQDATHELATDHMTGLRRELERSNAPD